MEWDAVFAKIATSAPSKPAVSRPAPPRSAFKKPVQEKKVKEEELDRYEQKKDDDSSEEEVKENLDVFEERLKKVNKDLNRLDPVRQALFRGKSLDVMFIIDCTGSMGSWIEASKKEIKSIIECIRNQYFGIIIRVSIVAYRDHCDGDKISEIFPFS